MHDFLEEHRIYHIQQAPATRNYCNNLPANCPRPYPHRINHHEPCVRIEYTGRLRYTQWLHWRCFNFNRLTDDDRLVVHEPGNLVQFHQDDQEHAPNIYGIQVTLAQAVQHMRLLAMDLDQ